MKLIHFLRGGRREQRRTPRERLQNTMPGETGALAALRLGFLIN
ncbi:hypothetical protein [Chelativorans salis]|uniref:Uncharacterized protein n=1 Tax=Chelativorans salis TaxID=2978478 RepID=A0ABT2LLD5_9HYPH|nr:hypothetical protein [Chelativorans sp. EGI FJ00035]MCT7375242.1 hypothetical protein [Chelativorans sp. EGI FJ00035]